MSENVDILFVNPGDRGQIYQKLGEELCAIEPPVFVGLFANHARLHGASVAVIDGPALGLSTVEIARTAVDDFKPRLVVIVVYGVQPSASTQNMGAAGAIAQHIKEAAPGLPVMMTGTHPAALPERTLREESVDFVCDGEGPGTVLKTLRAVKAGRGDFSAVPGLWWRDGDTAVPPAVAEPLITNLDTELPGIAFDLLPMERYRAHNWHSFGHLDARSPYGAIHTSLGCPYSCSFCCINAPFGKPSYRLWSPDFVVAEIERLVEGYGVRNLKFVDEMFVLNERHVLGICDRLVERDYDLNIWAYARVDTVKERFLERLKAAGVTWLCLGIESASAHVRDGAEKRYGNRDIVDAVGRIRDAGIHVIANYIFGLPDDTPARMQETLDLALELNCEFTNFYSAMAYPGSRLYDWALRDGIELPDAWHHYSQHSYDSRPMANDHCEAAEILAFRDDAWRTYFTAPRYLGMIRDKFGEAEVEHVKRMTRVPLPRRLTEQRNSE